jgi:hypothetical protein
MSQHVQNKGQVGPVTKGSAAGTGIAGAAGVVLVWVLGMFGLDVPEEVAAAIVVLIGALGTFIGGKVVKPETAAAFQRDRGKPVD